MKSPLSLVAAIAVSLSAIPASAQQQVRFSGTTSADTVLVKDILQMVLQFSYGRDGCQAMGLVTPKTLNDYLPANENYRTNEPGARYERWDIELCEKTETFLITFWPSAAGGSLFKISTPPPADLPPAAQ